MENAGGDAEDTIPDLDLAWLALPSFDWRQAANPAFVARLIHHLETRAQTLQEDTLHPFNFLKDWVKTLAQDPNSEATPWGTVGAARDAPHRIYILGHSHWNAAHILAEADRLQLQPTYVFDRTTSDSLEQKQKWEERLHKDALPLEWQSLITEFPMEWHAILFLWKEV